ncbi:hypothetical protein T05_10703 [Trichinella murrelli]|uniref:Uncharacterized protein n=1 Tax=Trichinella murrelli TaxID=144512 RepID=A0A0V0SZ88_9BILA|nr:hypothetical protein T05_10703 [Trichinella murrelli]
MARAVCNRFSFSDATLPKSIRALETPSSFSVVGFTDDVSPALDWCVPSSPWSSLWCVFPQDG